MPKIQVMSRHLAEQIAAGEVVERPSSVGKELVENAIDAGASSVTVEIKNGGVTFLRVTDNGSGIEREDVPKAFLSHATSKLLTLDDLHSIHTLGFRGEALASIASVSRVSVLTRTRGEEIGTRYEIQGGEAAEPEDAGCPVGTTIVVRDLFYNTPARMKFLKKDVTEANAVAGAVDRLALSHPEVSFRLIREGRQTLLTPGDGKLRSAVYAVYGRDFASGLVEADYSLAGVTVKGLVSKPSHSRANRNMQHFFINGRFVKTRTAMAALEEAYKNSIMAGKFPACVLEIALPPEQLDVNVHPAKIEVRFANEKAVFEAVYYAAKNALAAGDTRPMANPFRTSALRGEAPKQMELGGEAPSVSPPSVLNGAVRVRPSEPSVQTDAPPVLRSSRAILYKTKGDEEPPREAAPSVPEQAQPVTEAIAPPRIPEKEKAPKENKQQIDPESIRFIGELFSTYILAQEKNRFLIVDKHAAHERILFERLSAREQEADRQLMLDPVSVALSKEEYDVLLSHRELLARCGLETEDFGGGTLLVRSVPLLLSREDVSALLTELAGKLLEHRRDATFDKLDWLYHSIACRAAIKAGDQTSELELKRLLAQVLEEDVRYCPHGRPVAVILTEYQIEKQFGRV